MTPERQRIAIAEACGWTPKPEGWRDASGNWLVAKSPTGEWRFLPNFLNDLNAMHSVEEETVWKDAELWKKYCAELAKLSDSLAPALHAAAAQRAEAFLRTIGKWEDK